MANTQPCKIIPLIDSPEHIPFLAKLWYEEISLHWAPNPSIEKAQQKLLAHLSRDKMPMAFVALRDNQPIGMACLRETDGIRPGVAPWLGSLVVHPEHRGCKVGEALIEAVKEQARNWGYQVLYLLAFDATIPSWYKRLGWQMIGDDELFSHRVAVMSISI